MYSVLFHARETGIAYVISTILNTFTNEGFKLFFDVENKAAEILPKSPYKNPDKVDLIICGYDDNIIDKTGKFLNNVSPEIPVLSILDSWKGVERFWYKDGTLRPLTNKLAVSDNATRDFLIEKGAPSFWPAVTGHPGIDYMAGFSNHQKNQFRKRGRELLGLNTHDKALLFLSEPLHIPQKEKISLLDSNTINNKSIEDWINLNFKKNYKIILRLHPIEDNNIPKDWLDGNKIDLEQAIFSSDLVIGLASTSLTYAVAAGKKVISLEKIINEWIPEFSNIPCSLWSKLLKFNLFHSATNNSFSYKKSMPNDSSRQILLLALQLIKESNGLIQKSLKD